MSRLVQILILLFALSSAAHAADFQSLLTREEFTGLANDLAPKVTLFADAWAVDPQAEFFGGTSRDFLYWIKGEFKNIPTREAALAKAKKLLALPFIDPRSFLIGDCDCDCDVITAKPKFKLNAAQYGIKKIDSVDRQRLDPKTEMGQTELLQGYIPLEKIRLAKTGLVTSETFGDGVGELYTGRPTVHFAPAAQFQRTHYARMGLNDPTLLAIRYVRILAMNYFYDHGRGVPKKNLYEIDPASHAAMLRAVHEALKSPALAKLIEKDSGFVKKFNSTAAKAFRSYTNPTATRNLLAHFGLDSLWHFFPTLEPTNQYLFAKSADPKSVAAAFKKFKVKEADVLQDVEAVFPGRRLYHGTRTGVLPSSGGAAGDGLYGTSERNKKFAEDWGQSPNRLVTLELSPETRIVDITQGPGQALYRAWKAEFTTGSESQFADTFGFDILRYPYEPEAFVVKNASILGRPRGVNRELLSSSEILARATNVKTADEAWKIGELMELNALNTVERRVVLEAMLPALYEAAHVAAEDPERLPHFLSYFSIALLEDKDRRALSDIVYEKALALARKSPYTLYLVENLFLSPEKEALLNRAIAKQLSGWTSQSKTAETVVRDLRLFNWQIFAKRQGGAILKLLRGDLLRVSEAVNFDQLRMVEGLSLLSDDPEFQTWLDGRLDEGVQRAFTLKNILRDLANQVSMVASPYRWRPSLVASVLRHLPKVAPGNATEARYLREVVGAFYTDFPAETATLIGQLGVPHAAEDLAAIGTLARERNARRVALDFLLSLEMKQRNLPDGSTLPESVHRSLLNAWANVLDDFAKGSKVEIAARQIVVAKILSHPERARLVPDLVERAGKRPFMKGLAKARKLACAEELKRLRP